MFYDICSLRSRTPRPLLVKVLLAISFYLLLALQILEQNYINSDTQAACDSTAGSDVSPSDALNVSNT
jgi:hypothetical protein